MVSFTFLLEEIIMSSTSATNVTNANDSNLQGFDGLVTMQVRKINIPVLRYCANELFFCFNNSR